MYSCYCFILNFVRVHKDDKEDMEMAFKEVAIESLEFNPFTKISKEWMLVTAGDEKKSNTMTASWGGVGIMWGKNIATAYIRPQRYTKKFMDDAVDGTTAVEEADLIFVCKTQYTQDMKPECFYVKENDEKWYPDKDYHTMYMGEIVKVLKRV